ncbi:hypothetical protein [Jatrophihabitans sp.]|jgi:hypothetical protein|uniref:hypothetical protein n=1 Tax=Jatrophihabitans sp. TaxID=1932789 RepID=UPI002EDEC593
MADYKLTKSVGEHWTCAELARRGWSPALTRDGLERTDLLAVGGHLPDRPTIEVQVKTANESGSRTSWPLGDKAQMSAKSDREWFVLAFVPRDLSAPIRGYVIPRDHVAAAAWIVHQDWLTNPTVKPGKRNAPASRSRVNTTVWERYEGRWDLLNQSTSAAPVLLPGWLRDRSSEPRVGLPPSHPWRAGLPPVWPD